MSKRTILYIGVAILLVSMLAAGVYWYKTSYVKETIEPIVTDTTAISLKPSGTLTLPHADTSLIPLFSETLDAAFQASKSKDYAKLGSLLVYRGPNQNKHGYDVFDTKNSFDKGVVKVTAEVFNKWVTNVESIEYARAFELPQPDGRSMAVLEVIFVSKKNTDRKFFGFLPINNEWKIADVTSYI